MSNTGPSDRKYTPEQKAAVLRIRRCKASAFYDILDLEAVRSTCTEGDIKKAYRKQSLLTHPDKNGYEHADEAFKMVSHAFGVLADKDKRAMYDRWGTDPDNKYETTRAQAQDPFSSARHAGPRAGFGGGGQGFGDEMTPEEMFQRFFGGGFGGGFGGPFGGGGGFDTGPQFVFNLGGNRGFRVHQMGGGNPRRRPQNPEGEPREPQTGWDTFISLLPMILLFVFPVLTSLFAGGDSGPATPTMAFDHAAPPLTLHRTIPGLGVDYYVNPAEVLDWKDYQFRALDKEASVSFRRVLRRRCETEMRTKRELLEKAEGWFFVDPEKMKIAEQFEMTSCIRMETLGFAR
ncbi:DUF1977-domain-containing protein [Hypoxylon fragiforme]|uniref:DUF1977-domain-containing protein n=1 Tax=Hypoxylon fragiforme TaxID=63214 RepID=UPI0020C67E1E|nr:DUF1977-domain-containing protein [Hypoxylon fragiforme]KAI2610738.1 DUF1977-domain-containing protein [Hypoxylon fragiforme]